MEGHLMMSTKELRRNSVFEAVLGGRATLLEAAVQLELRYRQVRRSYQRFREEGDAGRYERELDKEKRTLYGM